MITARHITVCKSVRKCKEGRYDCTTRYLRIVYQFADVMEMDKFISHLDRKFGLLYPRILGTRDQKFKSSTLRGPYKVDGHREKYRITTLTRLPLMCGDVIPYEKYQNKTR